MFPETDDVVMVQVKSIAEMGAYVSLLEYNNIEGMILLSELSRKRIRSITKLIKVGKQEPVMVLRVDREKGYIDLSKRRVSPEEAAGCEERYNRGKMVSSIMRHVAEVTGVPLEELNVKFTWPLYKMYGHAADALKVMVQDPQTILTRLQDETNGGQPIELLTEDVLEAIMKNIKYVVVVVVIGMMQLFMWQEWQGWQEQPKCTPCVYRPFFTMVTHRPQPVTGAS